MSPLRNLVNRYIQRIEKLQRANVELASEALLWKNRCLAAEGLVRSVRRRSANLKGTHNFDEALDKSNRIPDSRI